jgi:ankyrin repeat protein
VYAAGSEVADAVLQGKKDVLRSLLQKGADVNAPQIDGTTALHWAVRADDLEMADLLLNAGAKPSVANRDGATPLQLAALNGSAAMIGRLLKAGVDANSVSEFIRRHCADDSRAHGQAGCGQAASG